MPDPALVVDALTGADRIAATRGDGYALIYSAQGRKFRVRMDRVGSARVKTSWFNPRSGSILAIGSFDGSGEREFVCPSEGFGSDWVLVLDAERRS